MRVYVGALWHEDCDAFIVVYAKTAELAQKLLDDAAKEEFESNLDSDCECGHDEHTEEDCPIEDCECTVEDTIRTGGVSAEDWTENELAENAGWQRGEAYRLEEFKEDGYQYGAY